MSGGIPRPAGIEARNADMETISSGIQRPAGIEARNAGMESYNMATPQPKNLTINQLDAQEERNRPGLLTGVLRAGAGAINEVGQIAKAGGAVAGFAAKSGYKVGSADNPATVLTNRVLNGLYKKAHEEFRKSPPQVIHDVIDKVLDFGGDIAANAGKSIGIDNSRPGPNSAEIKIGQNAYGFKMDRDVAIQKWTNKPLSAVFDLMVVKDVYKGIVKGVIKGAVKENAEKAVFDALKNNGDNMSEMINAIKPTEGAAATSIASDVASIPGSMPPQVSNLSPGELFKAGGQSVSARAASDVGESPIGKLLKHKDIITKDITRRQLNDPKWALDRSNELSGVLLDISKAKNKQLDAIVDAAKSTNVDINKINSELLNAKNAALTPETEAALGKYAQNMGEEKTSMTLGEARERIRRIDDQVYGTGGGKKIDYSESDKALMTVRGILRDSMTLASPEYDKVAKEISSRIGILGGIEGSLLRAEGTVLGQKTASNIGLKIVETPESVAVLKGLLKELGNSPITAKSAGEANRLIELIDASKAWNNYFGKNESIFSGVFRDTARNTSLPFLPESIVRPVNEMLTMGRLNDKYSNTINTAGKVTNTLLPIAKKAVKKTPFAARVLDQNNK
jgi:hypothetical protein